ncbi:hypothetical protein ACSQ8I_21245 [Marinovum sp. E06]|uniref:hypothetical protein n=1 Tax=Marinovum sp. E06 TaxID=3449225 RepID=UPI003EDCA9E9
MKTTFLTDIADPLLRRMGTAISAALVGYGVAHETSSVIATGTVALCGVAFDLLLSHLNRKARK